MPNKRGSGVAGIYPESFTQYCGTGRLIALVYRKLSGCGHTDFIEADLKACRTTVSLCV